METKINIEEILKDKPQGTKLYDWLYNIDVELDTISTTDTETVVWCTNETDNNTTCHRGYSGFGTVRGCNDGLQILLPSKEMRDWRKFSWKKGDVLVSNDSDTHIIFKGFSKSDYTTFEGKHWISVSKKRHVSCLKMQNVQDYHIEDNKESAQTYINTIEERLGGKLNRETFEIEKVQPEFKDGDIIYAESDAYHYPSIHILNTNCDTRRYYARLVINGSYDGVIDYDISAFDDAAPDRLRFATEEERQQLFKALANEGKAWDAEKKMIVVLKSLWTPKPFDKVLVRNSDADKWLAGFFEKFEKSWNNPYHIMNLHHMTDFAFKQCIPYEGNESLLGTTKDVEGLRYGRSF